MTKEQLEKEINRDEKIMIIGIVFIILSISLFTSITMSIVNELSWLARIISATFSGAIGIVGAVMFTHSLSSLIGNHLKIKK